MKKRLSLLLLTVTLASVLCGCGSTTSSSTESDSSSVSAEEETAAVDEAAVETIVADIDEVINTYNTNSIAGNKNYKNKNLVVTGEIYQLYGDSEKATIQLITEESNLASCKFTNEDEISKLLTLTEGQTVTIEGYFDDIMSYNTYDDLWLDNCKLK